MAFVNISIHFCLLILRFANIGFQQLTFHKPNSIISATIRQKVRN